MPEQPNRCTTCGSLLPYTNAAYYCSEKCMKKARGEPMPQETMEQTIARWRKCGCYICTARASELEAQLARLRAAVNANADWDERESAVRAILGRKEG